MVDRMAARPERLDADVAELRLLVGSDRNGAVWFTLGVLESCVDGVARSHRRCDEADWCGVCNAVSLARESLAAFAVVVDQAAEQNDTARAAG